MAITVIIVNNNKEYRFDNADISRIPCIGERVYYTRVSWAPVKMVTHDFPEGKIYIET